MRTGVLGAVLAGGASSRFGSDKALAVVGGRSLLDHARAALARVTGEVVVVGRRGGIPDRPAPGMGPLSGIAGALDHAASHGFASVLTMGCDMPEVPDDLLLALLERAPAYCPQAPVLGHWPVTLATGLADRLSGFATEAGNGGRQRRNGALSVRRWAEDVGALATPSPAPLRNVNTPADLPPL